MTPLDTLIARLKKESVRPVPIGPRTRAVLAEAAEALIALRHECNDLQTKCTDAFDDAGCTGTQACRRSAETGRCLSPWTR